MNTILPPYPSLVLCDLRTFLTGLVTRPHPITKRYPTPPSPLPGWPGGFFGKKAGERKS